MDEKYHTWHKYFVYLPVYLTGSSSLAKVTPFVLLFRPYSNANFVRFLIRIKIVYVVPL